MSIEAAFAARALQNAQKPAVRMVRGRAFPIRLYPDAQAEDRLTIGVAFVDEAGNSRCKLVRDFSRLECLYDQRVDVKSYNLLADVVESDLQGTVFEDRPVLSENIEYGEAIAVSGFSVEDILSRAFASAVRFGLPRSSETRWAPIRTEKLREQVKRALLAQFGDKAKSWAAGRDFKMATQRKSARVYRFPIRAGMGGAVADVCSAWAATAETVESNLQRAITQLMAVRIAEHRHGDPERPMGLFLLTMPAEIGVTAKNRSRIDELVQEARDLAEEADVAVATGHSAEQLAAEVGHWCQNVA